MTRARDLADYVATGVPSSELDILDGLTATVSELNLVDGGTARGTTAVADGDGFLTNDGGTMRMTSVDTLATYMQNKIIGGTSIVTTGTLDSGAISSGFGNIDIGSSTITTTGLISGGSLDIDDVLINGTTIGHTDDTDLITLADGVVTVAGELDATTLDISGNADIDGTLEADAITVNGTALATYIRDTVGTNMLSSNTESGITVTYDTTNDNIDFAVDAAQTGITSLLATDIKIGEDDQTKIDFETADEIHFYAANAEQVYVADGVFGPQTDSDVDLGTTGVRWKDAYVDSVTSTGAVTAGSFVIGSADINENDLESIDGITAGTVAASKAAVVDANKDITGFRNITLTGELDAATLDVSGNVDIDGTLETDNLTVGGAQGSDGQVLTSTGSGVGWEALPASGTATMIASTILTSAASSITLTGFSSTYDHYRLTAAFFTADDGNENLNVRWTQDNGTAHSGNIYGYAIASPFHTSVTRDSGDDANDGYMFGTAITCRQNSESVLDFHLIISHPKNDLASATISGWWNNGPYTNGLSHLRGIVIDKDLDVGGIEFTFNSGDNFGVGSYVRIEGLSKS